MLAFPQYFQFVKNLRLCRKGRFSALMLSRFPKGVQRGVFTIISEPTFRHASGKGRWFVVVRCFCGRITEVLCQNVLIAKSCGCTSVRSQREKVTTHGMSRSPLYAVWVVMKSRCCNPDYRGFSRYGARGITVCQDWAKSFELFKTWALANGYEAGKEIDRIDNNGNYEPGNCRWVTRREQCRNTSANRLLAAFGETKCLAEWAADHRCQVSEPTLRTRIRYGWMHERAIATPPLILRKRKVS